MSKLTETNYLKLAIDTVKDFTDQQMNVIENHVTDLSNGALMYFVDIYEKVEAQVLPLLESVPSMLNMPAKAEVDQLNATVAALNAKVADLEKKLAKS